MNKVILVADLAVGIGEPNVNRLILALVLVGLVGTALAEHPRERRAPPDIPDAQALIDACWAMSLAKRSRVNNPKIREGILDTVLCLEDVIADEIKTDAALFADGLGLDSIDALEIAMVIEARYGLTLDDDPEQNQPIVQSVRTLPNCIPAKRQGCSR